MALTQSIKLDITLLLSQQICLQSNTVLHILADDNTILSYHTRVSWPIENYNRLVVFIHLFLVGAIYHSKMYFTSELASWFCDS